MRLELSGEAALEALLKARWLPDPIVSSPVRFARHGPSLELEPSLPLPSPVQRTLREAGVVVRRGPLGPANTASSWPEVIACRPSPAPGPPLGQVIFLLEAQASFLELSAELLRLGAPTQEWARFVGSSGEEGFLVRVVNPPYYVALKALERRSAICAYRELAPRVWVELGFEHPLVPTLRNAPDSLRLINARGPWKTVPDGPWARLEDHLELELPMERRPKPAPLEHPLRVRLRLEPSSRSDPARLWVLRGTGTQALERLLRHTPSAVVAALELASLSDGSGSLFAVRAADLGEPPPALDLEAEAYAPRGDLPNLYLPLGTALAPPLTVDELRRRLAPVPEELVWITPLSAQASRATPPNPRDCELLIERVPQTAFGPLTALVDYIIDQATEPLQSWVRGAMFDFAPYRGRAMVAALEGSQRLQRESTSPEASSNESRPTPNRQRPAPAERPPNAAPAPVKTLEIDERAEAVATLERAMAKDPPRSPEGSVARWMELGRALAALGRAHDAALSFARAAWATTPGSSAGAVYADWLSYAPPDKEKTRVAELLATAETSADEQVVIEAQRWLDTCEARLPVHLVWLLRCALARAVGGDELGLLRARDAIIARTQDGLSLSRDVPSFVRRLDGGHNGSAAERLRNALNALADAYLGIERHRSWNEAPEALTRCYVGLLLEWGHARLGHGGQRRAEDLRFPKDAVDRSDPIHGLLIDLFESRIVQAWEGQASSAPVRPELVDRIRGLGAFERFKLERLWIGSEALGGIASDDPFRRYAEDAHRAFAGEKLDPDARAARLTGLLQAPVSPTGAREALALLTALAESDAVPRVPELLRWTGGLEMKDQLVSQEALLRLAEHLERPELVALVHRAMAPQLEDSPATAAEIYARTARILARAGLGLKLSDRLAGLESSLQGDEDGAPATRLRFATARAILGDKEAIDRAMDAARPTLDENLKPAARLTLVRAIALAVAQSSPEKAVEEVRVLQPRLAFVTDMFSTNSHFCVSLLHFMESLVLALTGPNLTVGPQARRWLDDDEASLRTRIHQDLQLGRPSSVR